MLTRLSLALSLSLKQMLVRQHANAPTHMQQFWFWLWQQHFNITNTDSAESEETNDLIFITIITFTMHTELDVCNADLPLRLLTQPIMHCISQLRSSLRGPTRTLTESHFDSPYFLFERIVAKWLSLSNFLYTNSFSIFRWPGSWWVKQDCWVELIPSNMASMWALS